jgi:hypothetical protein
VPPPFRPYVGRAADRHGAAQVTAPATSIRSAAFSVPPSRIDLVTAVCTASRGDIGETL